MKKLIKVIIADRDADLRSILKDTLVSDGDMCVAADTASGAEAASLAESGAADVLVTDIVLPELDGIGVLERVSRLPASKRPACIVISSFDSPAILEQISALGVRFFIPKPFDVSALAERIRQAASTPSFMPSPAKIDPARLRRHALEYAVTDTLHKLGIPPKLKGYHFIREGVLLAIDDMDILGAVTKVLYPAIARRFNSTAMRVERSIRNAIEVAWKRGDVDVIDEYFGYTVSSGKGKPTNGEFIALLADRLRLEFKLTHPHTC